jgi:hypothetical protein
MSYKDKIFTFWGAMDLLAIGSYLFYSLKMGHVPIWSDIQLFYAQLALMEVSAWVVFFCNPSFLSIQGYCYVFRHTPFS